MTEKIQVWKEKIKDISGKYSTKQKSIVLSVLVAVILTICLLAFMLSRVSYKQLITCKDTKQSSEVVKILQAKGIDYKLSNDSLTVSVDEDKYDSAQLELGANDIGTDEGMTMDTLFNTSISTTESERKLKSTIYWQDKLANTIKTFEGVKDAVVYIASKDKDSTVFSEEEEKSASIVLTTTDAFKEASATSIAQMVASALSTDVKNVRVTGSNGSLLYDGNKDLYTSGDLNSKEEFKQQLTNTRANDVRILLLKQGYDDVEVMPNFAFDMNEVEELYTEYTPTEGSDQGVYKNSYEYKADNVTGVSGIPGTDTNNETPNYEVKTNGDGTSSVKYSNTEYLPNERKTNTKKEIGAIVAKDSSISIVLSKYKVYSEETLKEKGDLDDKTFEEYIVDNKLEDVKKLDVDENLLQSVSAATGISTDKVTITAYEQPIFKFIEKSKIDFSKYVLVALLVIIFAMLVFVVIKASKPVKSDELEPELSVEELLVTKRDGEEESLDDILYNEKSESRRVIENFVDEKPDAVANLLRNWLNEDW